MSACAEVNSEEGENKTIAIRLPMPVPVVSSAGDGGRLGGGGAQLVKRKDQIKMTEEEI